MTYLPVRLIERHRNAIFQNVNIKWKLYVIGRKARMHNRSITRQPRSLMKSMMQQDIWTYRKQLLKNYWQPRLRYLNKMYIACVSWVLNYADTYQNLCIGK